MKRPLITVLMILAFLAGACAPAATPAPIDTATPAPTKTAAAVEATATSAPTATAEVSPTPGNITVSDGLGGEIIFAAPPQRIVALAPSVVEILYAVGAGKQIAAREDFTNYPPEALELPSVGGMSGPVSVEQVVAQKPDLVMVAPISPDELVMGIRDLGVPIMRLPNPKTLADLYEIITVVGKVTGHDEEASALVKDLAAREKKVGELVATVETKPVVFYELDATEPAKPWTAGPGSFVDMLIGMAGGTNAAARLTGEWAQISQEELLVVNPDVVLLGDSIWGITVEDASARPGWDALKAVQNKQVFPFNDDLVSRPGPRMLDGLEEMVRLIHPELADQLK